LTAVLRGAVGPIILLLLVGAPAAAQTWQGSSYDAVVMRVLDGDTIQVQIGSLTETVRYIGVNTPKIDDARGRPQYGDAARQVSEALVMRQPVKLVLDVQPRDGHGRLLAYVYVAGLFVNAELVRRGFAEVASYPPNVQHRAELVELQRQARQARRGLWAVPEVIAGHTSRQSGVAGVRNVRVYLHADDPGWRRRPPEDLVFFESVEAARAEGYTPSMDYQRLETREREALAGGPQPFVTTLTPPGPPARGVSPVPAERRERQQDEVGDAGERDPSDVIEWLLNRRNTTPRGVSPQR
jgi:micrococcal nuclease